MLPTVITGLSDDSTCMQEEIFGKCLCAKCNTARLYILLLVLSGFQYATIQ